MPASPARVYAAGRAPLKASVEPTCAPVGLLGSVAIACRKTFPVTVTSAPLTATSIVRRYHVFSRMFPPSETVVSAVNWPCGRVDGAEGQLSELPLS